MELKIHTFKTSPPVEVSGKCQVVATLFAGSEFQVTSEQIVS